MAVAGAFFGLGMKTNILFDIRKYTSLLTINQESKLIEELNQNFGYSERQTGILHNIKLEGWKGGEYIDVYGRNLEYYFGRLYLDINIKF